LVHERPTEETQETAALYALGALSQIESQVFEAHLQDGCASCRDELARFEEVVGSIAASTTAPEPPPYIRDLLMARIEKEVNTEPSIVSFRQGPSLRTGWQTKWLRATVVPWAIAASLLICFIYSLSVLQSERELAQARLQEVRSAQKELVLARQQLLETSEQVNQLSVINSVLSTDERRLIALTGQPPAPSASGNIYWDVPNRKWVVSAKLPQVAQDKVYELWFVTRDRKVPAGLIKPDEKGQGFIVIDVPADLGRLAAAAITLEPEAGSPQPTGPIYALGVPR
jgi:anti-sigma-K factor RskA